MSGGVFSVLALARPRSQWLRDLTAWTGTGSLEIDLVRCISVEEIRSRLSSMQRFSAVLLDADAVGIDRDLLAAAVDAGSATIIITTGIVRRDWLDLGADHVLDHSFRRDELLTTLRSLCSPLDPQVDGPEPIALPAPADRGLSPLIAVTGPGGSGTSIVALAVAQHIGSAALVDGALHSSLALMIGDIDPLPALQEFVEAHRVGTPRPEDAIHLLRRCERHGLDLLPGLRHHRDWTALRPRAITAALDTLRRAYPTVVADIDCDLEGESDTGSFDIADRNALTRIITGAADLLIVTGRPDLVGMSRQVDALSRLLLFGVDPHRIIPLVLRPPRCALSAADVRRSVATLLHELHPDAAVRPPEMIDTPRDLDLFILDGASLPAAFVAAVGRSVPPDLTSSATSSAGEEAVPVQPGTLGIAS